MGEPITTSAVILVTGRAPNPDGFEELVDSFLFENFELIQFAPLEDEDERDFLGNLRYVGFVIGEESEPFTARKQVMKIRASGGDLGASQHDSMAEAIEYAESELGYDDGGSALAERLEIAKEMVSRFKKFNVQELEFIRIFTTLMQAERMNLIRGLVDDEPVIVVATFTQTEEEISIRPYAVLCNSPAIMNLIEMPTLGSRE